MNTSDNAPLEDQVTYIYEASIQDNHTISRQQRENVTNYEIIEFHALLLFSEQALSVDFYFCEICIK